MTTKTNELTDRERMSAAHHCRVAAERYDADVALLREDEHASNPHSGIHQLIETFTRQAREARELADKLEDC